MCNPPGRAASLARLAEGATAPPPTPAPLFFIYYPPDPPIFCNWSAGWARLGGTARARGGGRAWPGRGACVRLPPAHPAPPAPAGQNLEPGGDRAGCPRCSRLASLLTGAALFLLPFFFFSSPPFRSKGKIYIEKGGEGKDRKQAPSPSAARSPLHSTPKRAIASARQFFTKVIQPLD